MPEPTDIYDTGDGEFNIVPRVDSRVDLVFRRRLDGQEVGRHDFDTADQAREAVQNGQTGFEHWDDRESLLPNVKGYEASKWRKNGA